MTIIGPREASAKTTGLRLLFAQRMLPTSYEHKACFVELASAEPTSG